MADLFDDLPRENFRAGEEVFTKCPGDFSEPIIVKLVKHVSCNVWLGEYSDPCTGSFKRAYFYEQDFISRC